MGASQAKQSRAQLLFNPVQDEDVVADALAAEAASLRVPQSVVEELRAASLEAKAAADGSGHHCAVVAWNCGVTSSTLRVDVPSLDVTDMELKCHFGLHPVQDGCAPAHLRNGDHVSFVYAAPDGDLLTEHHGIVVHENPIVMVHVVGRTLPEAMAYLASWDQFLCNTLPTHVATWAYEPCDDGAGIRARALAGLGVVPPFDAFTFNCEHYARRAVTGVAFALQQLHISNAFHNAAGREADQQDHSRAACGPCSAAPHPYMLAVARGLCQCDEADGDTKVEVLQQLGIGRMTCGDGAMGDDLRKLSGLLAAGTSWGANGEATRRWCLLSPAFRSRLVGAPAAAALKRPEAVVPIAGIPNFGNTCYFATAVQCLAAASGFRASLKALLAPKALREGTEQMKAALITRDLLDAVRGDGVDPVTLARSLMGLLRAFDPDGIAPFGRQFDAARALNCLLRRLASSSDTAVDVLLNEALTLSTATAGAKDDDDACVAQSAFAHWKGAGDPFRELVIDTFGVCEIEVIHCEACSLRSRRVLLGLRAEFPWIRDGGGGAVPFVNVVSQATLADGYRCERCAAPNATSRLRRFLRLPPCLVLRYDGTDHGSRLKIPSTVSFPSSVGGAAVAATVAHSYRVDAVAHHVGGAHYTAAVQWQGLWVTVNDAAVDLRDAVPLESVTVALLSLVVA